MSSPSVARLTESVITQLDTEIIWYLNICSEINRFLIKTILQRCRPVRRIPIQC